MAKSLEQLDALAQSTTGFSEEAVERIASAHDEPDWLRQRRRDAWHLRPRTRAGAGMPQRGHPGGPYSRTQRPVGSRRGLWLPDNTSHDPRIRPITVKRQKSFY